VDEESGPPLEELGPGSGPSAADEMCERDMGFYHRDANTPEGVVFIR
jgi:hypothetical protein